MCKVVCDKKENNIVHYSLPDFYNYYQLNTGLLKLMNDHPGYFRDNIKVDSMYGTFPGCIWNSGRTQFGMSTYENILNTIGSLNQMGISVRFTFTNGKLTGRHFKDYYGNIILEIANEFSGKFGVKNGVNIGVESFKDFINTNYPNLYTLWSTTIGLKNADQVNDLSKDSIVVIPYQMNNTDIIDKFLYVENIEVLCCESCIDNCPDRQAHYSDLSDAQLIQPSKGFKCPHGCELYYYYDNIPKRKHYISPEMIESHYLPRGINQFKISGRNDNIINVIERYVTFLAKPEYKDEVRNHLLLDHLNR